MKRLPIYITVLALVVALISLVIDRKEPSVSSSPEPVTRNPQPASSDAPTPHLVRQLIDASKHLSEQIEAIRSLPGDLTEGEYTALIDLLHQPSPAGVRPGTWTTLQNEIMEVLRSAKFASWQGYAPAISSLLLDKEADPVMRDYAAQHLVLYLDDRAQDLSQHQRDHTLNALLTVLQGDREARHQVIGTTLMALCDLNRHHPELLAPHRAALGQTIQDLLSAEKKITLSNQIAAIQAAGRLRFPQTLPTIRTFAQGQAPNPSARLSSIAALGYFADPTDKAFLTKLAQGTSQLRFAAQTALKNYSGN